MVELWFLFVLDGFDGQCVDVVLVKLMGFFCIFVVDVVVGGGVCLDGVIFDKFDCLCGGGWFDVEWQLCEVLQIVLIVVFEFGIVYDDDDIIVVDKFIGVVVYLFVGWDGFIVVGVLVVVGFCVVMSGVLEWQGVVYWFDVGISGLMVVVKLEYVYIVFKQVFKDCIVEKVYYVVVQGYLDLLFGMIDVLIGWYFNYFWKFVVVLDGKLLVMYYEMLEVFFGVFLLEIYLEMGCMYQICVYMVVYWYFCVGDLLYGVDLILLVWFGFMWQWLYVYWLGFVYLMMGDWVQFELFYFEDFCYVLDVLCGD